MFGKIKRLWANVLNMGNYRCGETPKPIGTQLKPLQLPVISSQCQVTYSFVITTHCEESVQTILDRLELINLFFCFGAKLELESHIVLGAPSQMHMLRIHAPNGGQAIEMKKQLSLMNFEEVLMWPTFSDGWINIQFRWKQREALPRYLRRQSSSPRISQLRPGTPIWTQRPSSPWTEE